MVSSRSKSSLSFWLTQSIGIIVQVTSTLVMGPLAVRSIGTTLYGLWLGATELIVIAMIVEFAIWRVLNQRMGYLCGKGDLKKASQYLNAGIVLVLLTMPLFFLVFTLIGFNLHLFVHLDPADLHHFRIALMISLFILPFNALAKCVYSLAMGMQHSQSMNKGYLYAQIASTLITTAGIYKGFELYSFAAGSITNTAIVSASSLIFVLKIRKTEEISFLGFNWEVFKDTYKSTLQHVWGLIGEVLGTLNVMFVTLFVSADAAVIYSLNRKVLDIPIHISNLLVLSLSASYAHGLGSGTQFPAQKIALELSHFNAAIASSISLFYVVILPTLIKFWIGEEYFAGSLFMFLSAVSAFTSCQMSISYALNHASGEYAHANLLMLIGNIARILLIPLLVASYGINMMPLIQILISACFVIRLWKLFWKTIQKQGFGLEPLPELNNKILFLHGSTLMLCILLSVWKLQGNILWVSLLGGTLFVVNMAAHIAVDPFLSRQRQLIIQSLLLVRQIGKRFLSKKVAHFESQETV